MYEARASMSFTVNLRVAYDDMIRALSISAFTGRRLKKAQVQWEIFFHGWRTSRVLRGRNLLPCLRYINEDAPRSSSIAAMLWSSTVKKHDSELGHHNVSIDKDHFEVTLEPEDDPKKLPGSRRWGAVFVICSAALCVACSSSIVSDLRYVHYNTI
jgi:hypothetical protein